MLEGFAALTWVVIVLVLSAAVGAARGGRLSNLTDVDTRAWWLLVVGLVLQIVATATAGSRALAIALLLVSYGLILAMVWINRQEPGMWIAGIGLFMNFVVIALNGGMPVLPASAEIAGLSSTVAAGGRHVLLDQGTIAPFLADIIPLPGAVISLGDVFLAIGLGVFIEEQMRKKPRLFRKGVKGESGSAARER